MLKLNDPDSLEHRHPKFIRSVAGILEKTVWPYHRAEVRGLERIPDKNGVIYVGNHNGFPYMTEAFLFTSALFDEFRMSRFPYILMHDLPLKLPLSNQFFTSYGCLRATQQNALRVMERDEPLLIYPGGSDELMRPHRDRTRIKFEGRTGYIRLAIKYNRPIVPVIGVGGHSTALILDDLPWLAQVLRAKSKLRIGAWPLILSFPWGLTLGPVCPPYIPWPSKIIVEALDPMVFPATSRTGKSEKDHIAECAQTVERTMAAALTRLEAERVQKYGLVPHAVSSMADFRQWLEAFLSQAGQRCGALFQRLTQQAQKDGELPDADQVFAALLKQAAMAQSVAPEPRAAVAKRVAPAAPRSPTLAPSTRLTESQILHILKQGTGNRSVKQVCQEHQIAESTYYRWRAKYAPKRRPAAQLSG